MNGKDLSIGCVIMAAGNSIRFGANKLESVVNGKTVIEHAFDAVPLSLKETTVVVTQYDSVETLARKYGFSCVRNTRPEDGVSLTIRLGTEVLKDRCDATLYMVSDQPLLKSSSIEKLIECYLRNPGHIVSASHSGKRGNPCIFPGKYYEPLMNLSGDTGGSTVIQDHKEDLILVETDSLELIDIDTKEDHFFLEYGVPSRGSE